MTETMTTGNPLKLILRFSLPLLLGNLLQQTYNMVDAAIVGRYLGTDQLAAVGSSSSVQFLVMGFCIGICVGFAIPVAQRYGAEDHKSMRAFIFQGAVLAAIAAILVTTLCAILCPAILRLLSTPSAIYQDAYDYLFVIFLGIPFSILYNYQASILRAVATAKRPFSSSPSPRCSISPWIFCVSSSFSSAAAELRSPRSPRRRSAAYAVFSIL